MKDAHLEGDATTQLPVDTLVSNQQPFYTYTCACVHWLLARCLQRMKPEASTRHTTHVRTFRISEPCVCFLRWLAFVACNAAPPARNAPS